MHGLEVTVVLGAAVFLGALLSRRLRIPAPLVLLVLGLLLGFFPQIRDIRLDPSIVLLLFLPVMLFWESLTTSLRALRRDLRGIVLMSTLLVVVSAFVAAAIAHLLGLPWAAALVLGAALAPPDATAVAALGRTLPHRNFMLLKAESLTNDGTALVVYALAIELAMGGRPNALGITVMLARSYVGGIITGLIVAGLAYLIMRRLEDPLSVNLGLLLIPFAAYLLAELAGASGVLAVVVAGIVVAASSAYISTAASRRQTEYTWPLGSFVLNGALFVLIGITAQRIAHAYPLERLGSLALLAIPVWLGLLVARLLFQTASIHTIRLIDRRPQQQKLRMSWRARVVSTVAGFRGGISLAIALSVPFTLTSGAEFPNRQEIIFVTASVIMLTLFVQGPVLPLLVRWAQLPDDVAGEEERRYAEIELLKAASKALPQIADERGFGGETVERVEHEVTENLALVKAMKSADISHADELPEIEDGEEPSELHQRVTADQECTELRLALVARKRDRLWELRRNGDIDDTVARELQTQLDIEEVRTAGVDPMAE